MRIVLTLGLWSKRCFTRSSTDFQKGVTLSCRLVKVILIHFSSVVIMVNFKLIVKRRVFILFYFQQIIICSSLGTYLAEYILICSVAYVLLNLAQMHLHYRKSSKPLDVVAIDHFPSLLPRESSTRFANDSTPHLLKLDQVKRLDKRLFFDRGWFPIFYLSNQI